MNLPTYPASSNGVPMVESSKNSRFKGIATRRKTAAAFALVVVAALIVTAVASGTLFGKGPLHYSDRPASAPATSRLIKEFALFQRAKVADAASGLPAYLTALAKSGQGTISHVDFSEAQQVPVAGGQTMWVVPGGGYVCFIQPESGSSGYSGACQTEERVTQEGTLLSTNGKTNGEEAVYGLAPNGDPTATIELADGTKTTADVQDNVYSYVGHGGVIGITLHGSRSVHTAISHATTPTG